MILLQNYYKLKFNNPAHVLLRHTPRHSLEKGSTIRYKQMLFSAL